MPEPNYFHDYRQRSHEQIVLDLNVAFKKIRALYFLIGLSIGIGTTALLAMLLSQW